MTANTSSDDGYLPCIYVEWVDSMTECSTAWHDRAETVEACATMPKEDMVCRTAGFLLVETDDILVVTQSHHKGEVGTYLTIPKVCVLVRHELKHEVVIELDKPYGTGP